MSGSTTTQSTGPSAYRLLIALVKRELNVRHVELRPLVAEGCARIRMKRARILFFRERSHLSRLDHVVNRRKGLFCRRHFATERSQPWWARMREEESSCT
jgi:hypothetical protein